MSEPTRDQEGGRWHLDKRVPIALIFAIAAQSLGAVWFASAINQRVAVNEATLFARTPLVTRMVKTETRMESIQEDVREIKGLLQRAFPYEASRSTNQGQ